MRVEGTRGKRIQIRDRFGVDCNANADPETIADAEILAYPQILPSAEGDDAVKIDSDSANPSSLILPA